MKRFLLIFIIIGELKGYSQELKFTPEYSIVLDSSSGNEMLIQCSRVVPRNIDGFWSPSQSDIDSLENNFKKVYLLTGLRCCVMSSYGKSLDYYGFQYLGVTIKTKRFIYINAFPVKLAHDYKVSNKNLKTTPIRVCDGGTSFWGVMYDVTRKAFKSLEFNGFG